jgi:general secretion pathway protein M
VNAPSNAPSNASARDKSGPKAPSKAGLSLAALPALARLRAGWGRLAPRERRLVATAAALLSLAALWWLAIQPAWTTLRTAPARLDALEAQTQAMRLQAAEARELRQSALPSPAQAAAALQAASDRLGPGARLTLQGERAVLMIEAVGTDALRDWLTEVRSGARARPIEAQLSRSDAGFSGSITVALPAPP